MARQCRTLLCSRAASTASSCQLMQHCSQDQVSASFLLSCCRAAAAKAAGAADLGRRAACRAGCACQGTGQQRAEAAAVRRGHTALQPCHRSGQWQPCAQQQPRLGFPEGKGTWLQPVSLSRPSQCHACALAACGSAAAAGQILHCCNGPRVDHARSCVSKPHVLALLFSFQMWKMVKCLCRWATLGELLRTAIAC